MKKQKQVPSKREIDKLLVEGYKKFAKENLRIVKEWINTEED